MYSKRCCARGTTRRDASLDQRLGQRHSTRWRDVRRGQRRDARRGRVAVASKSFMNKVTNNILTASMSKEFT